MRDSHTPAGMLHRALSEAELFKGCIDTYGRVQASHGLSPGQVELFDAAKSAAMHTVISARIFSVATPGISQLLPLMEIGAGLLGASWRAQLAPQRPLTGPCQAPTRTSSTLPTWPASSSARCLLLA